MYIIYNLISCAPTARDCTKITKTQISPSWESITKLRVDLKRPPSIRVLIFENIDTRHPQHAICP